LRDIFAKNYLPTKVAKKLHTRKPVALTTSHLIGYPTSQAQTPALVALLTAFLSLKTYKSLG
jgi:hypothetical protein